MRKSEVNRKSVAKRKNPTSSEKKWVKWDNGMGGKVWQGGRVSQRLELSIILLSYTVMFTKHGVVNTWEFQV